MKKITLLFTLLISVFGFSQNLITNGDFTNGATNWTLDGGGTVVSGEAFFSTSSAAGNPWDTQLVQGTIPFTAAAQYRLTFKSRAVTNRNITVAIQNPGAWTDQFRQNFALTTTMQTYTATFSATSTFATAQIAFMLGSLGSTAGVYFDDITLVRLLPLIQNFETPVTYTSMASFGGAVASVVTDPASGAANGQVLRGVQGPGGDIWQGIEFVQTAKKTKLTTNKTMTVDVYCSQAFNILAKVEQGGTAPNSANGQAYTTPGQWQTLTFNFAVPMDNTVAANGEYQKIVFFGNWNSANTGFTSPLVPLTFFIDNIRSEETIIPTSLPLVLGFETTESGGVNGAPFGGMAAPVLENGTGSNTTRVLKIVGNTAGDVWQGINLNLTSLVNLTDTKTMTMDVLSADPITFLVKVTGGVGGPGIVAASASHPGGNTWQTVSFTFNTSLDGQAALANGTYSGFVIHTYWAQGATAFTSVTRSPRTFFVDNIRGPLGTPPVIATPTVAAPTPPNRPAADVKSIYSNAYTPLTTFAASGDLNSYDTSWCPGVTSEFLIGGNAATAMNRITGLGSGIVAGNATTSPPYQGSDLVGGCEGINFRAGSFDATSFTHFHIDIWTPIRTMALRNISLKLSNHNASNVEVNAIERNITNATPLPNQLPSTDPNPGTWLSFDIPLADFTIAGGGSAARNNLAEFIISTNLGIVYYDNVYFHKNTVLSSDSFAVSKVNLYPNPTSNVLNIESLGTIQAISVYNVLGQEVINKALNSTSTALDVSSLNSGIYVVKTVVDGVTSSTKFIKQ
jgi:hypothetical protein